MRFDGTMLVAQLDEKPSIVYVIFLKSDKKWACPAAFVL